MHVYRCVAMERAGSEFSHQLQRDVDMVTNRCRQCADEANRMDKEWSQFVDSIDKTAATVRETVSGWRRHV